MIARTRVVNRAHASALLVLSLFVFLSMVSSQTSMQPVMAKTQQSFTLYMGKTTPVGQVVVSNDASNLYVEYIASAGWAFTEVHLAVATSLSGIPQSNGNPPPGKFEYSAVFSVPATDKLFTIPLTWGAGTPLYVAAHAVVTKVVGYRAATPAEVVAALPSTVDFTLSYLYPTPASTVSYVTMNILSPAGMSGLYPGWCGTTTKTIIPGQNGAFGPQYTANVYSSYDTVKFAAELYYYRNMSGPVNWLLNQNVIGTVSSCTGTQYTWSDIQLALWILLDEPSTFAPGSLALSTLGTYDMNRANCLVQAALEHSSFYPQYGQSIALLIVPTDGSQEMIIKIPLPGYPVYGSSETAWAGAAIGQLPFPGKNWATYFTYTVT
jgi:hypothetical protein